MKMVANDICSPCPKNETALLPSIGVLVKWEGGTQSLGEKVCLHCTEVCLCKIIHMFSAIKYASRFRYCVWLMASPETADCRRKENFYSFPPNEGEPWCRAGQWNATSTIKARMVYAFVLCSGAKAPAPQEGSVKLWDVIDVCTKREAFVFSFLWLTFSVIM